MKNTGFWTRIVACMLSALLVMEGSVISAWAGTDIAGASAAGIDEVSTTAAETATDQEADKEAIGDNDSAGETKATEGSAGKAPAETAAPGNDDSAAAAKDNGEAADGGKQAEAGSDNQQPAGSDNRESAGDEDLAELCDLLTLDGEAVSEEELVELDEQEDIQFNGYIYKVKNEAVGRRMDAVLEEVSEDCEVEEILDNELYAADSLETISTIVDPEDIEYIEPDIICSLDGDVTDWDAGSESNELDGEVGLSEDSGESGSVDADLDAYSSTPNDKYYKDPEWNWIFNRTNASGAWSIGQFGNTSSGKPVTVVVIDSGIDSNHPDINYDRVDYYSKAEKPKTADRGITYYGGKTYDGSEDAVGHGTFVAGVIAGRMNNSIGITGAVPALNIYPVKIYEALAGGGYTGGSTSDIIRGINRAINMDADVINMSLGTPVYQQAFEAACTSAQEAGLILVASVGNEGSTEPKYPAGYDGVIGVGATTSFNAVASFSNKNSTVDVVAPGLNLMGLAPAERTPESGEAVGYKVGSGTSYSTPMVSALAGMCKSIDPDLTSAEFMKILKKTSTDLGAEGRDNSYGYGIINYKKAALATLEQTQTGYISDPITGNTGGLTNDNGESPEGRVTSSKPRDTEIEYATIKLAYTSYVYTGKRFQPAVKVYMNGNRLTENEDYVASYIDNLNVGKAMVVIAGIGQYSGTKLKFFNIRPMGTTVKSASRGKHTLKVKWNRRLTRMSESRVTGYQVQIAKNKAFTKGKKTYTVKGYKKYYKKIENLKRKTRYYVRVRTYTKTDDVTVYSKWSACRSYRTR